MDIDKFKKIIVIISVILFITSLTQPTYYIDRNDYDAWSGGIGLLFFGWIGAFMGGAALSWFANPLILISWISLFKNEKTALWTSVLATFFSFFFFLFDKVISSEAPIYSTITEYKLGYWLWLLSIVVYTMGLLGITLLKKISNK